MRVGTVTDSAQEPKQPQQGVRARMFAGPRRIEHDELRPREASPEHSKD